jgi:ABC-type multidrug transport system fused ATPase/permease subunit
MSASAGSSDRENDVTNEIARGVARLYRTLWRLAEGRRLKLTGALVTLVVAQSIRLSIPWLFGRDVAALQQGQDLPHVVEAARMLGAILLAAVIAWALHGPARVGERSVALFARQRFADELYARAASLPLAFHQARHSGDTLHRIQKTTGALFQFAQHSSYTCRTS